MEPMSYRVLEIEPEVTAIPNTDYSLDDENNSIAFWQGSLYIGHPRNVTINGESESGIFSRIDPETWEYSTLGWDQPTSAASRGQVIRAFPVFSDHLFMCDLERRIDAWTGSGWAFPFGSLSSTHNVNGVRAFTVFDHPSNGLSVVVGGESGNFTGQEKLRIGTIDGSWANLGDVIPSGTVFDLEWAGDTLFIASTNGAWKWTNGDIEVFYSDSQSRTWFSADPDEDVVYFYSQNATEWDSQPILARHVYRLDPSTDTLTDTGIVVSSIGQSFYNRFQVIVWNDEKWLMIQEGSGSSRTVRLVSLETDKDFAFSPVESSRPLSILANTQPLDSLYFAYQHTASPDETIILEADVPSPPFLIDFTDVELLPFVYTTPDEQIRVFVGGEETDDWAYDEGIVAVSANLAIGDNVVVLRETRWDRSWVQWTGPGFLRRVKDANVYFRQRLYLLQEFCELETVADLIGFPLPSTAWQPTDDLNYSITVADSEVEIDVTDLPFPVLSTSITGSIEHQLEVAGVVGILDIPFDYVPDEPEPSEGEWSIVDDKIVVAEPWGTLDFPYKVKRVTRLDRMWHILNDASSLSSTQLIDNFKQIAFLKQESCGFPPFPPDHPLSNTIFPRDLNLLNFTTGGPTFSFKFMPFVPTAPTFVWVDGFLIEDFFIDWPNSTITVPDWQPGQGVSMGQGGSPGGGSGLNFPLSGLSDDDANTIDDADEEGSQNEIPPIFIAPEIEWGNIILANGRITGAGFGFHNFQPGWRGETGFGPAGWVTGVGTGLRYENFETGEIFVELGQLRPGDSGFAGEWVRGWSYTFSGVTWSWNHTLSWAVGVTGPPPWAIALREQYLTILAALGVDVDEHPIGQLLSKPLTEISGSVELQIPGAPGVQELWTILGQTPTTIPGETDQGMAFVDLQNLIDYVNGIPPFPPEEPE